jgi:hypothetical protein
MWYIHSSASTHIFHERKWFLEIMKHFHRSSSTWVSFYSRSYQGKGNIKVSMSMKSNEIIEVIYIKVLHVPRLTKKYYCY